MLIWRQGLSGPSDHSTKASGPSVPSAARARPWPSSSQSEALGASFSRLRTAPVATLSTIGTVWLYSPPVSHLNSPTTISLLPGAP
ncbi:MAG: hypothetical protein IPP44_10620 [Ideonella sp.]|nr:hypothetical protein [Ideonella sp.]